MFSELSQKEFDYLNYHHRSPACHSLNKRMNITYVLRLEPEDMQPPTHPHSILLRLVIYTKKRNIEHPINIDSDGLYDPYSARSVQLWSTGITISQLAKFALKWNPVTHPIYKKCAKDFDGKYQ